ncbi:YTH domain-containing protein ECT3-like isoform X1 [Musa acuminata AAA Group]|uniref:YTH domain-containing protein ECT3-like isoform X1 n=1 Tax=Musa acuminata AAA Group TaxID=214697 RepID=UPI0031CE584A
MYNSQAQPDYYGGYENYTQQIDTEVANVVGDVGASFPTSMYNPQAQTYYYGGPEGADAVGNVGASFPANMYNPQAQPYHYGGTYYNPQAQPHYHGGTYNNLHAQPYYDAQAQPYYYGGTEGADAVGNVGASFPANMDNSQAQSFYYGGYGNPSGTFVTCTQHVGIEGANAVGNVSGTDTQHVGIEGAIAVGNVGASYPISMYNPQAQMSGSAAAYSEERPLIFNAGNGYGPYMPNGPYYPSAMPAYVGGNVQGVSYPSTGNNNTIRERGNASFGRSNGTRGFLRRQSRRPWTNRSNNRAIQQHSVAESGSANCSLGVDRKLYNSPEFVTEYDDGKIFIIKSYSEANVHKSIKYGVWSSTSAGNKKLNSAYIEAQEKGHSSPIFLFFSVNASGRFCGVAEMIGPVDFEKSVDYWNKDKWTGQFPVKWHIVKDVPSFRFRHIILENNDNKPVTNSRDTQEVKLEQGLEMLSIFKTHEYKESILDAFEFYDKREAALRRRKAHQQETRTTTRNKISKRFVQVVKFKGETSNVGISTDKTSSSNGVGSSPTPKDV